MCSYLTARVLLCRQGGAHIQTIITVLLRKTNNVMWHGKKHIESFISDEKQLFYAWRYRKIIRAYVNTPAAAKLAIAEWQKCDHSCRFFKGSQKTLKCILIRWKLNELEQKQWKHVVCTYARKGSAQQKTNALIRIEMFHT